MSGKKLPPPKSGAGLSEALRSRHADADPAEREDTTPAQTRAGSAAKSKVQRVRRSWYLSETTADALAEAVEDLHFATRQPKNVILDALIAAALEQRDTVAASLTDPK